MVIKLLMVVLIALALLSLQVKSNQLSFGQTDCTNSNREVELQCINNLCMSSNPQAALECARSLEWKTLTDDVAKLTFSYPVNAQIEKNEMPLGFSIMGVQPSYGIAILPIPINDQFNFRNAVNRILSDTDGILNHGLRPTSTIPDYYTIQAFSPSESTGGIMNHEIHLIHVNGMMYEIVYMWFENKPLDIFNKFSNSLIFNNPTKSLEDIKRETEQMSNYYKFISEMEAIKNCTLSTMIDNMGGGHTDIAGNRIPPPGC